MTVAEESRRIHTLEQALRGYSCPSQPFSESLHDTLLSNYARDSLRHFIQKYGDMLANRCPALHDLLQQVCGNDIDPRMAWDICFGMVHETVLFEPEEDQVLKMTAQLMLWCQLFGFEGEWKVHFQEPCHLRLSRWAIWGQSLQVRVQDGLMAIRGDVHADLHRLEDGSWSSADLPTFPFFGIGNQRIYLISEKGLLADDQDRRCIVTAPEDVERMRILCQNSIEIIRRYAPEYLDWVFRAIRYVYPMREEKDVVASGSTRFHYGQIHLSYIANPLLIAESLVHEAAHQYFYIASRMGPVDDGSDKTWYYSPPVQAERQIEKILLAFHAFVNVIMLTRRFKEQHFDKNGYVEKNERLVSTQLQQLLAPLKDNPAMSTVGRALSEPLIEYFA